MRSSWAVALAGLVSCSSSSASVPDSGASSEASSDAPFDASDASPPADASGDAPGSSTYDMVVLADHPVGFWDMRAATTTEPDLTGNGNTGSYAGGTTTTVRMPNGDEAVDFNGSNEYLSVPSNASFSIPTKGTLTWETWIRPDVLQFPKSSGGYVDYMGKCASYSPTCEWESRMYDLTNPQNRTSRLSAYVFNPTAGLGSSADWQPANNVVQPGTWHHVIGEYQTMTLPTGCNGPQKGGIDIWVDGVEWDQAAHLQTGCMSQYGITPVANDSPLHIGTMALDTWFQGAIGKVAVYDYLLSAAQITNHFHVMTGLMPNGTCGATCTSSPH
jgi:hypothetical protein